MKKDLKILVAFVVLLLSAVLCGIFAGNYVASVNINIVLSPPVYMQKMIYISPWFMIVAVMAVVLCGLKLKSGKFIGKTIDIIAVYTFTVMGIIISGFCGMYTMADFVKIAIGMVTGVMVIVFLTVIQLYDGRAPRIYNRPSDKHWVKGVLFVVYGVVAVLSAFVPLGPLPVVIVGMIWSVVVLENKHH